MCDENGNWNDLSKLWHAARADISATEVEGHDRRHRHLMTWLRWAEGGALALAFAAAVWIAMQTAFIAMTAISVVCFGTCGYLQHRMRREPMPPPADDLLTSLRTSVAREDWNLAQLGAGRAITLLTLAAIVMIVIDHLRHLATTPPGRLEALAAIAGIVVAILAWNLVLTTRIRRRKRLLQDIVTQVGAAP